ncbi:hypothetical protein PR048_014715 [Dryococelus australis]|uniref:Uncharacterized protein n=1 Tax=Dryococelus australis TaxID=614101 RepID=A0ABQ9HF74_9NEOP|nr:hypothetical protein PR048_014715 [Dryococelus australis]
MVHKLTGATLDDCRLEYDRGHNDRGRGGVMVRLHALHLGETGSIPRGVPLRFSPCGNRARRCRWSVGFLRVLLFPHLCIPALLHTLLASHSSALKTSMLSLLTLTRRSETAHARRRLKVLGPAAICLFVRQCYPCIARNTRGVWHTKQSLRRRQGNNTPRQPHVTTLYLVWCFRTDRQVQTCLPARPSGPRPPACYRLFTAEKRGSDKGDTATLIKGAIAAKSKVLNWCAVFSSLCISVTIAQHDGAKCRSRHCSVRQLSCLASVIRTASGIVRTIFSLESSKITRRNQGHLMPSLSSRGSGFEYQVKRRSTAKTPYGEFQHPAGQCRVHAQKTNNRSILSLAYASNGHNVEEQQARLYLRTRFRTLHDFGHSKGKCPNIAWTVRNSPLGKTFLLAPYVRPRPRYVAVAVAGGLRLDSDELGSLRLDSGGAREPSTRDCRIYPNRCTSGFIDLECISGVIDLEFIDPRGRPLQEKLVTPQANGARHLLAVFEGGDGYTHYSVVVNVGFTAGYW